MDQSPAEGICVLTLFPDADFQQEISGRKGDFKTTYVQEDAELLGTGRLGLRRRAFLSTCCLDLIVEPYPSVPLEPETNSRGVRLLPTATWQSRGRAH